MKYEVWSMKYEPSQLWLTDRVSSIMSTPNGQVGACLQYRRTAACRPAALRDTIRQVEITQVLYLALIMDQLAGTARLLYILCA